MWIWWSFRPFSHLRLFDSISTHLSPLDAYMNFLIFLKLKNPSFSEHACTLLLPCIVSIWHPYHPPPPKKKPFSFTLHSSKPWLSLKAYEDEQVFTFHPVYYQIWCVDLLSSLHSSSNSVVEETGLCSVKGMAVLKLFSPMNLSLTYQSSKIFSESSNLGSLLTRS